MSYSLSFSQSLFMLLYIADKVEQGIYDFIPTQQIAQDLNIPPSTAGMILRRLNRVRIIETREGANGGVRMVQPPDEVSLLHVFVAIEQERPMFQTNIQLRVTGEKPTKAQNTILQQLATAESAMKQSLHSTTIRNLIQAINQ